MNPPLRNVYLIRLKTLVANFRAIFKPIHPLPETHFVCRFCRMASGRSESIIRHSEAHAAENDYFAYHTGPDNREFTQALGSEELVHVIMGSFRLQMYKWRIAKL